MDNLSKNIAEAVEKKLEEGIIERVLEKKIEEAVNEAIGDLFKWNGVIKKTIEKKIEEALVPVIERRNFDDYVLKLDSVLMNLIKTAAFDNNKILKNFNFFVEKREFKKVMELNDLLELYAECFSSDVDTYKLTEDYMDDDGSTVYESVELTAETVNANKSYGKEIKVLFKNPIDSDLNYEMNFYKGSYSEHFSIFENIDFNISQISLTDKFKILLLKLKKEGIEFDLEEDDYESLDVRVGDDE